MAPVGYATTWESRGWVMIAALPDIGQPEGLPYTSQLKRTGRIKSSNYPVLHLETESLAACLRIP